MLDKEFCVEAYNFRENLGVLLFSKQLMHVEQSHISKLMFKVCLNNLCFIYKELFLIFKEFDKFDLDKMLTWNL